MVRFSGEGYNFSKDEKWLLKLAKNQRNQWKLQEMCILVILKKGILTKQTFTYTSKLNNLKR